MPLVCGYPTHHYVYLLLPILERKVTDLNWNWDHFCKFYLHRLPVKPEVNKQLTGSVHTWKKHNAPLIQWIAELDFSTWRWLYWQPLEHLAVERFQKKHNHPFCSYQFDPFWVHQSNGHLGHCLEATKRRINSNLTSRTSQWLGWLWSHSLQCHRWHLFSLLWWLSPSVIIYQSEIQEWIMVWLKKYF